MSNYVLLTLFCVVAFIAATYIWFSILPYRVLKKCGIKHPPTRLFFGNYKELVNKGLLKYLDHLRRTFGEVVGYYNGRQAFIVVTDLELIKAITVKDFEHFIDRYFVMTLFENLNIPPGLLASKGEEWRTGRKVLSPTFSAAKMKMMEPLIYDSVQTLVKVFKDKADTGQSIEIFRMYGNFTMESILSTAFGRVVDIQKGESSNITKAAANVFSSITEDSTLSVELLTLITSNFPIIKKVAKILFKRGKVVQSLRILMDASNEIIKQRRLENSGKRKDLLQLMIDANVEGEAGAGRKLTDGQIVSYSLTFLLAGYETTANALTYTSYLLALHPAVQQQLQEEIDEYFSENPTSSLYQASQDLKYLDMILNESLRLYPPAPLFQRVCVKETQYGDITIPKGAVIQFASLLLHQDPEYWEDSTQFNPLRFTPEEKMKRPPMCFLPFGTGPRNCLGMRFAIMEAKMALIELMKKISFVRSADTEVPLKTTRGVTMSPKNGVFIKLESRNK